MKYTDENMLTSFQEIGFSMTASPTINSTLYLPDL
jgi:hypothetical protein